MGGGHGSAAHHLLIARDTPVHRAAPQIKLVALGVFVAAVAVTPPRQVWAIAVHAAILAIVVAVARIPPLVIARRLLVVGPFLVVAAVLPFIGDGPRTDVGPWDVSIDGLWAGWGIAARTLLGATASIVLTATTGVPTILLGLTRLRVPRPVVAIIAFMIRYLDLAADRLHRMRRSMTARAHDPRWLWQARPVAAAAGTTFVRTFEQGERIHQAMLARGYTGHMPDPDPQPAPVAAWLAALAAPAIAVFVAVAAVVR